MSSKNTFSRPPGCVSIPVEIVPPSNSKYNSSYRTSNTNSSSWKKPSYSTNRFQPRQSPTTAYDRLINNSPSYQPYSHRVYESRPIHVSHSNEDLLSSSKSSQKPPKINNNFHSDFIQSNKNSYHRSYDALDDYPEQQNRSTFINSNEDRVPINTLNSHDRSHSPASQCDESPTRPPPPSSQQESDFKINNPPQSNDQQVPTPDLRDPNTIALEKLEQLKQNLADLNEQVEAFTGTTRDDRLYKILDEQSLKMMMRCDELIDVSPEIKEKRKEMIRNVQTVLAKLESKVPIESNSNQMETTLVVYDPTKTPLEEDKSSNSPKEEPLIEQST